MPVTPVSKDTCLKFIRGSHLWGKWFHSKKFGTHFNYDSSGQKTERTYEEIPDIKENGEYDILSWELEV